MFKTRISSRFKMPSHSKYKAEGAFALAILLIGRLNILSGLAPRTTQEELENDSKCVPLVDTLRKLYQKLLNRNLCMGPTSGSQRFLERDCRLSERVKYDHGCLILSSSDFQEFFRTNSLIVEVPLRSSNRLTLYLQAKILISCLQYSQSAYLIRKYVKLDLARRRTSQKYLSS